VTGRVYLVGAGPGDPDLLTVKALRLLRAADVILHDELVPPAILRLASPAALLCNVGKRCGAHGISQQRIIDLMLEFARAKRAVVRLKGGDPQVFGRAWEEITALRAAGIPFEIVPGITAALGAAAAAEIPLTARCIAPGIALVTYHRSVEATPLPWQHLIASNLTIAMYMPGENYDDVAVELRTAGLGGQTPCAVISRAALPEQRVLLTTLDRLGDASPMPAPTLLIIGEVARPQFDSEAINTLGLTVLGGNQEGVLAACP
jgi:uroporphyrin-III C-methyltransferase